MNRTPEMQSFLDGMAKQAFGRTNSEATKKQICVICGKPATEFSDELSKKEYTISGMCQICQDATFGPDDAA